MLKNKTKNKKFAGFTLIELLVVIVIIGILSTISIATFSNYRKKAQLAKVQHFAGQLDHKLRAELTIAELEMDIDCNFDNAGNCIKGAIYHVDPTYYSTDTVRGSGRSFSGYGDGTGIYPTINDSFTITEWVNSDHYSGYHNLYMENYGILGNLASIYIDEGVPNFILNQWGASETIISGVNPLPKDTWHFIHATYDETLGIAELYVDGELVASSTGLSLSLLPTKVFIRINTDSNDVKVDELRVYPVKYDGSE